MKFGATALAAAEGAILAHTLRTDAAIFKKGRVLTAADLESLAACGVESVAVARLEAGDLGENEAAARVAAAIAGAKLRVDEAFTGRANLFATAAGLAVVDGHAVDALNAVSEDVTVATLASGTIVGAGDMVATVKVIPFGVAEAVVSRCTELAATPCLRVAAFQPRLAGMISTTLPGASPAVAERAAANMARRLAAIGSELAELESCPHAADAVAAALRELAARDRSPILVLGASAIVDRGDVIPQALLQAGGRIERLGMPVDPGNLLLLGELDGRPVVGVPGCARSLKRSGFDRVLESLVAGLPVDGAGIASMGVGGLLAEVASRPQPRRGSLAPERRVGVVVLAAGASERMGAANKLLVEIDGRPMLRRVVDEATASGLGPVVVVLGHEADLVAAALEGSGAECHRNADYRAGMSASLRVGIDALEGRVDAAIVALGDMPWIRAEHFEGLAAAYDPGAGREICVPVYGDRRGNPVLFDAGYFPEMRSLDGDVGAKRIVEAHAALVHAVAFDDPGVVLDVDTPSALGARADSR